MSTISERVGCVTRRTSDKHERARITDLLERALAGEPWHGPSLRDVLKGVTADDASRRPVPGAHTIWELVLHLTSWNDEVTRRLAGHAAGDPVRGDWPAAPKPTERAWRAARANLTRAHRRLVAAIERLPNGSLDRPVRDYRNSRSGVGASVYQTLNGIIQHDAYHAGQIALLRRALEKEVRHRSA
jgi:uncharacterized damage-inducible protein DinB